MVFLSSQKLMWCLCLSFQDKVRELQNMGSDVGLEVVDNALLALQGEWPGADLCFTGFLDCSHKGHTRRKVWVL